MNEAARITNIITRESVKLGYELTCSRDSLGGQYVILRYYPCNCEQYVGIRVIVDGDTRRDDYDYVLSFVPTNRRTLRAHTTSSTSYVYDYN